MGDFADAYVDEQYSAWCYQTEEGMRAFATRMFRAGAEWTERRTALRCAEIAMDADTNYDAEHSILAEFRTSAPADTKQTS